MALLHAVSASAIPAKKPIRGNLGVVVVDMQDTFNLTYRHGLVDTGIERVISLLLQARALDIPRILVDDLRNPNRIIPEIMEAAGSDAKVFPKTAFSLFQYGENVDPWLVNSGINTLVVVGYKRTACVFFTIEDALKRGYDVMTSDELQFGYFVSSYNLRSDSRDSEETITATLGFYRKRTTYFETADELMLALRRAASCSG